jgi:peptidoglycan/LPS O-acetylase OafA/YrhL
MIYRPEIDGLRAFAVLPVIFFHAGFPSFSGGFVGVDVFFVISGYLITSIISAELDKGSFTLAKFYERRARRILPALFFVMFASMPAAWLIMMPHQLQDFGQALVATSLYVSNILFWLKSDYFAPAAELNPLLHTWSLAVEEQYYIFYPLMLMLLWSRGKKIVLATVFALGVASLTFSEWASFNYPSANFFLLTSRAWELMVGGILGLAVFRRISAGPIAELGAAAGLALICLSVVLLDGEVRFPGLYALMPVLGTASIIYFASSATVVGRFLSLKPIVGVGLLSYSAYLWHQPLFAFARLYSVTEPSTTVLLLLAASSLGLAYVSWRYVEAPFRNRSRMPAWTVWKAAFCATAVTVSIGLTAHLTGGFQEIKYNQLGAEFREYDVKRRVARQERKQLWDEKLVNAAEPFDSGLPQQRVLVIGDSVANDLYVSLELLREREGLNQYQFRRLELDNLCVPVLDVESIDRCGRQTEIFRNSSLPRTADLIVVSAAWENRDAENLTKLLDYLGDKTVIVYGPAPFERIDSLLYHLVKRGIPREDWAYEFARYRHESGPESAQKLREISAAYGVKFIDKYDLFCNESQRGLRCDLVDSADELLIIDQSHVSIPGAIQYGTVILQRGWLTP